MKETSFMNFRRPGVVLWSLLPLAGILLLTVLWWTLVYAGSSSADSPLDFALGVLACAVAFLLGLIGLWHGWRFRRSIDAPVERMHATLEAIADGDLEARVRWNGGGELAALANALDRLLDERVVSLDRATRDNEDLNTSVVGIMQAVGTIAATKDLGVRVPVTEDVTGAIADALNLLTEEMSRVLDNVGRLADDVAHAVDALRGQSDRAITAGAREQKEVALAAGELSTAAQALVDVAQSARQVDHFAVQALAETGEAVRVVGATIEGIVQSREQIRRTEKRIKRLGERSQEIGQVVGMIQAIAERTGILALNASMKAVAAGEAGAGFAEVADEVKRLSGSARESAERIARLVTAIQNEANDTARTMNEAITEVVAITRMADEASQAMQRTHDGTGSLVGHVRRIAATSEEQARKSSALQTRADIIVEASAETARQLRAQSIETRRLVGYARSLVEEVRVFRTASR